jgi:AcrR family transcriptional regulator
MIIEVEQALRPVEAIARPRYRRLPCGPSGMAREEIARNQRARLYGGMVNSVVARGYDATTVADLISYAGVSRRTFYQLFRDRADCLLAAYNSIVAHARSRMIAAMRPERGWANRLYAACRILFNDLNTHPKGAHFVLVDSLGIAPGARERVRLTNLAFERLLYATLRPDWQRGNIPRVEPCAIVGGVRHLAFTRVRERRGYELEQLADEVLDWIESYRTNRGHVSAARRGTGAAPTQTQAFFLQRQDPQARILSATVRLIRELGYVNVTDSQLARSARLPTQALHKQFPDKEGCFIAVIEAFLAETLESTRSHTPDNGGWPVEVHRAMTTYVDYLAAHRALLQLAFVDLFDIGPTAVRQMIKPVEQLIGLLTQIGPPPLRGPRIAREAITGAIWATIFSYASRDRVLPVDGLADQLTFIVLAPHIGPAAATEELLINQRRRAA